MCVCGCVCARVWVFVCVCVLRVRGREQLLVQGEHVRNLDLDLCTFYTLHWSLGGAIVAESLQLK